MSATEMQIIEHRESVILENNGTRLFAILHRPVVDHPVPVVLTCHGFAGTKVGRYRLYVRLAEALAKQGIATLRLDFRGCGDSEGSFSDTTLEGQVADAMCGLEFLTKHPNIDPNRIGVLGRSLGGPVSVLATRRFAQAKSLVLWAAVFHGDPWMEEWQEAQRCALEEGELPSVLLFQGHLANPALFQQFFGVDMADELGALHKLPLLCVHSHRDEIVDYEHAEHFRHAREDALGATRIIRLEHSNHDFSDPREQETTIQETVRWFKETL